MKTQQPTQSRHKRTASRKPVMAAKPPVVRKDLVGNSHTEFTPEELEGMIAAAAYIRAEKRGFAPGHELEDWLAAEREIRETLTETVPAGHSSA